MEETGRLTISELIEDFGDWFNNDETVSRGRMTSKFYPYHNLFSPIRVNGITLKNRIMMGPIGNVGMVEESGKPSQKMIAYFAERARGGAGLIASGMVPVSYNVEATLTEPGNFSLLPRIDGSRTLYPGWRTLAETIHAHGAHFFIQLSPGVGRVGSPECLIKKYRLPVSSSWNPNFYIPQIPCRPLSDGECHKIIRNAAQAAADAKELLIDGVYLHGHEGYLLEQMSNPAYNRRDYGKFRDYMAFGLEMIRKIRERVGSGYPVMYRIDLSLALKDTYGEDLTKISSLKKFKNERTLEMTLSYMAELVKAGVDMFDVDMGCYDNWWLPHPPGPMPPGLYLSLSKIVKDYFDEKRITANSGSPVVITAVGKLGYPDLAETALREGRCDVIMLARPLLADLEWPNKVYAGRIAEIRPCIGDQEACLNEFIHGGQVQCAVNPRAGHEDRLPRTAAVSRHLKKVGVVGAGPAGITFATTASQAGHEVTLFERYSEPGGQLVPGSKPRFKYDIANYLEYLKYSLKRMEDKGTIKFESGVMVSADFLEKQGFDVVVTCNGGKPLPFKIPGTNLPHFISAEGLLRSVEVSDEAREILIIGGGHVGCETALMLAVEAGKKVTVVEKLPYLMKNDCTANRGYLLYYLKKHGVSLLNCTHLVEIKDRSAKLTQNVSPTVPDPYNTWTPILPENVINPLARKIKSKNAELEIGVDMVVLALGYESDDSLYQECVSQRVAPEIRNIGDSSRVGRIFEAVKASFETAIAL